MARQTAAKPSEQSLEQIAEDHPDLGLFSTGGPFENFPGPVLIAGRNGIVLGANAAADRLAKLLRSGGTPELREAINSALEGRAAQINPLLLERESGKAEVAQAFDLIALPWADAPAALLLGRDITLERSLRAALIESRQRFKDLVDASSDFAWETDPQGHFSFVSEGGALGYAAAELIGQSAEAFLAEGESAKLSPFQSHVPLEAAEIWFRRAEGGNACLSVMALPLFDANGVWRGCRGLCRDITEERARELALARARGREHVFAHILRVARDELEPAGILTVAADELTRALPASGVAIFRRLERRDFVQIAGAGGPPPQSRLKVLLEHLADADQDLEEETAQGRLIVKATRYRDRCNGALCVWQDPPAEGWGEEEHFLLREIAAHVAVATEQLGREEELERLSTTDPLTGLLNRQSFLNAIEHRFARAAANGRAVSLFFIDVDNFKLVNDSRGHQAGDEVLAQLGTLIGGQIRTSDLAGRLGGDEFALFIEDLSSKAAGEKGKALLTAAETLEGHSGDTARPLGLSIGIAIFDPKGSEGLESLLTRADKAMYAAKQGGKGGLRIAAAGKQRAKKSG